MTNLILHILILTLTVIPCHASSKTVIPHDSVTFPIHATYSADIDPHTVAAANGEVTIRLPDGTVAFIKELPSNIVSLTVYPIPQSDAEAYDWIAGCIGNADIRPFLVYLTDSDGNRFNAEGIEITVILPDPYNDPSVFSLNTYGTVSDLSFTAAGDSLTFTANGSEYYILSRKVPSASDNAPQTDDVSYPILALLLSALLIFKFRRKSC